MYLAIGNEKSTRRQKYTGRFDSFGESSNTILTGTLSFEIVKACVYGIDPGCRRGFCLSGGHITPPPEYAEFHLP